MFTRAMALLTILLTSSPLAADSSNTTQRKISTVELDAALRASHALYGIQQRDRTAVQQSGLGDLLEEIVRIRKDLDRLSTETANRALSPSEAEVLREQLLAHASRLSAKAAEVAQRSANIRSLQHRQVLRRALARTDAIEDELRAAAAADAPQRRHKLIMLRDHLTLSHFGTQRGTGGSMGPPTFRAAPLSAPSEIPRLEDGR